MTDKQPEALRLADAFENTEAPRFHLMPYAAAELRRLHNAVEFLGKANDLYAKAVAAHKEETETMFKDIHRLHEVNAELVAALGEIEWSNNSKWQQDRARAAIRKATGEQQ